MQTFKYIRIKAIKMIYIEYCLKLWFKIKAYSIQIYDCVYFFKFPMMQN